MHVYRKSHACEKTNGVALFTVCCAERFASDCLICSLNVFCCNFMVSNWETKLNANDVPLAACCTVVGTVPGTGAEPAPLLALGGHRC